MSNPASISGVDLTTPQGRQILQDALDILYGLIQKAGGVAAGPTTFDELRVRMLTVLGTINVVPEDKPPANVNSRLVTPWLTGQRGRGEVWRFEDQNDGGDLLEVRSQPYLVGTPTATSGDWEFRFTSAQRDPAGAYRSLGAIRFSSSGRIRTYDATEVLLFDSSLALTSSTAPLPKRFIEGLVIRYASASTITVSAGKARDKADGANMTLSSEVTVDKTSANTALGYERKTIAVGGSGNPRVATTSGNPGITGTSTTFTSAWPTQSMVGTISNSGATITGTGTKFLTEIAVGDHLKNLSTGASARVTGIASDTSLTLSAALTSSGANCARIENPTVQIGLVTKLLNTVASDTSATATSNWGTNTDAACYTGTPADTEAHWLAVWLLSGGSGTTVAFSTQRTTPFLTITGYTTSYRRIGWVGVNASGNIIQQWGSDGVFARGTAGSVAVVVLNASASSSAVTVEFSSYAPPTAQRLLMTIQLSAPNTNGTAYLRPAGATGAAEIQVTAPSTSTEAYTSGWVSCDGAQRIDYFASVTTGDGLYVYYLGYEDRLE